MQSMHALPKAVLHVLRHAEKGSTRRQRKRAADFGGLVLPKGSKILEKAAMLAADCRLQDWKDWRLRI